MKEKQETKLKASDVKRFIVTYIILLILHFMGALDHEVDGYSIERHLTGWSWAVILGYAGWKVLGKILD